MTNDTEVPAVNDTDRPPPVILRGQAQMAVSAALDDLVRAFMTVEAVSMAVARELDAQAERELAP